MGRSKSAAAGSPVGPRGVRNGTCKFSVTSPPRFFHSSISFRFMPERRSAAVSGLPTQLLLVDGIIFQVAFGQNLEAFFE